MKIRYLDQVAASIATWSFPVKFLASAAISALGGAGVLHFLIEYATYSYAFSYGLRPPVEGVPYLGTTVAATSLFLLVSGTIVTLSLLGVLRRLPFAKDTPLDLLLERYKRLSSRDALGTGLLVLISLAILGYLLDAALFGWLLDYVQELTVEQSRWTTSLAFVGVGTIIMYTTRRPTAVWWVVFGYTTTYYLFVIALIFRSEFYAGFLRYTGFGGGVAVVLQIEDPLGKVSERAGYLMLRTTTNFVVFNLDLKTFDEYPTERIHRLSYRAGGLHKLPHLLPN